VSRRRGCLWIYLGALALSHLVRLAGSDQAPLPAGMAAISVAAVDGDTDDGVAVAIVDQIGHVGLVVEADPGFVIQPATDTPFEQRATGADDVDVAGTGFLPGATEPNAVLGSHIDIEGTLHEGSSRASKNRFELLDPRDVLQRVVGMDVLEWSYRDQQSRHIGPMAEDFHSLFGLGHSDKSLAPRDLAGVTLLALQGLNEVVQEKDHQIDQLRREVAELKAMVEALGPQEPRSGSTTDR